MRWIIWICIFSCCQFLRIGCFPESKTQRKNERTSVAIPLCLFCQLYADLSGSTLPLGYFNWCSDRYGNRMDFMVLYRLCKKRTGQTSAEINQQSPQVYSCEKRIPKKFIPSPYQQTPQLP